MLRATDLRPIAVALAVGLGTTACDSAESHDAPQETEAAMAPAVPAGTSMTFTVDDDVASDSYEPGDAFTATLGADVAGVEGRPALPAGTKARWTVTDVAPAEDGGQALVAARLESVQLDDRWHPVAGTVTEVTLAPADTDQPAQEAQTVKTGADAETITRELDVGGSESDDRGTAAMAMGTATLAVVNTGAPAHIDAGSRITVRLSDTLVLGPATPATDAEGEGY